jgi:hypothetical protein
LASRLRFRKTRCKITEETLECAAWAGTGAAGLLVLVFNSQTTVWFIQQRAARSVY